jgi:periodic tryptophan protein 1
MAFHRNPADDPYLKQGGADSDDDEEDSASEAEDIRLRDSDLLILAARNEDDVSYLEVWPQRPCLECGGRGKGQGWLVC